jgi:Protein of unknown function (DUF2934)
MSGSFHAPEQCPCFKAEQVLGPIRAHVRDYITPAWLRIVAPEAWSRAMAKHLEQRIRERAYEIWESEGCSGNPEDHWSRAEQELKGAGTSQGQDAAGAITPDDKIIDQLGDFA